MTSSFGPTRQRTVELSQAAESIVDAGLDIGDLVPGGSIVVRGVRTVANLVDDDDRTSYQLTELEHAHAWRYAERLDGFDVLLVCDCGDLLRKTIPAAVEPERELGLLRGALLAIVRDAVVGVERAYEPSATLRFERIRDQARAVLDE
jgi:hypothetical protein